MGAQHTWELCDAAGGSLAELSTASGRSLTFKRNTYVEATFTVAHEDEAASLLLGALASTGPPKLRCYRRAEGASAGTVIFRGPLVATQETAEESSLLTATFRSPFGVLLGDGNTTGRFLTSPLAPYVATDAGQIAKALIDIANADSFTGLATTGSIAPTKTRDRTYLVGQNIGQAVQNLTSVLDGFDFYETFVDGAATTDAVLNVVASQGSDNSAARFEYGATTLANVQQVSRDTVPPQNCVLVIGGNGLTATYQDAASVAQNGRYWIKAEYSDVTEQATLDDKARALVRPNPVKTLTFTPDARLAPRLFDDFALADRCPFLARRGALTEDVSVRLNAATLVVDDNGEEATEIADPTSPDEDRVLRASLSAEVLDG